MSALNKAVMTCKNYGEVYNMPATKQLAEEAAAELAALREQVRVQNQVLMMYANEQNWKSINGLVVLQTLDHPWNPAKAALKGADHASL